MTHVGPGLTDTNPAFELLYEYLRFLDYHVKGIRNGLEQEHPVHYYAMIADTWQRATAWPPPDTEIRTLYMAASACLSPMPSPEDGCDQYLVDFNFTSGRDTRYERIGLQVVESYYASWHGRDESLLTYTSPPLPERG